MPFSPDEYKIELTPGEVLRRARALIESPEKWCKQPYLQHRYPGALCANLAIFEAAPGMTSLQSRASDMLWEATGLTGYNRIPNWNDAPERTHAEVLAAFDRAIALAETRAP